jgi:hypothetical protein
MTELAALKEDGVRIVRVTYPDLHGVLQAERAGPIFRIVGRLERPRPHKAIDRRPPPQRGVGVQHASRHPVSAPERSSAAMGGVAWCLSDQTLTASPTERTRARR